MSALVAVEGIDGSGKGTQVACVAERLTSDGLNVGRMTFPQYDENRFGKLISQFLNGRFGPLEHVPGELAALLFAGDRLESKPRLEALIATHDVVLLDRYVASNVAHQAARVRPESRDEFRRFLLWLEFELYGLPRPALSVWLELPVPLAQERIAAKAARTYTDLAADLQEADADHLNAASSAYAALAAEPGWKTVACAELSVTAVTEEILGHVRAAISAM